MSNLARIWIELRVGKIKGIPVGLEFLILVLNRRASDLFHCESTTLKSHWVLVVMDQYTRRIIGFGVNASAVDGKTLCRMFNRILGKAEPPCYVSSDKDPLFRLASTTPMDVIIDACVFHYPTRPHSGMPTTHLANEWSLLQNQCDSYEKYALLIKLVAIMLLGTTLLVRPGNEPAIAALIGVLWLQDAIWKTFQHRIETRLLQIEAYFAASQAGSDSEGVAYQLNTAFLAQRQRGGVLKEYFTQAVRPTVAFPYAALLILLVLTEIFLG